LVLKKTIYIVYRYFIFYGKSIDLDIVFGLGVAYMENLVEFYHLFYRYANTILILAITGIQNFLFGGYE
jgi:hypothetical protein